MKRFFFAVLLIGLGQATAQEYIWPTDAGRLLTSTFAESRASRFHAGIDVKTWGQVGYKVFAVRSGYISRIQVSPFGYGRVLYETLDTGETVVYAHLQRFNGRLADYVEREQEKRGRYSVILYPDKNLFPVQKGELIAFTGESGVGYPHLHFEMRDKANRPINPLSKGYELTDRIPPTIQRIALTPLTAHSRVAGDLQPLLLKPQRQAPGNYRITETVTVQGLIGFGVEAFDQMEGTANEFGTYRNRLFIDDREIFSACYERFSYEVNGQADLDRDYRLLTRDKSLFYKLFRDTGNTLPFYNSEEPYAGVIEFDSPAPQTGWWGALSRMLGLAWQRPAGVMAMPPGKHEFRIELADYWGNISRVSGEVITGTAAAHSGNGAATATADTATYRARTQFYDDFVRIEFQFNSEPAGALELEGRTSLLATERARLERIGSRRYIAGWPLNSGVNGPLQLLLFQVKQDDRRPLPPLELPYTTVSMGSDKLLEYADGDLKLQFDSGSCYRTMFVRWTRNRLSSQNGLPVVSDRFTVEPADVPLAEPVRISLRCPRADSSMGLGVYRESSKTGTWQFLDLDMESQPGFITAQTGSLGSFAILQDKRAPLILAMQPVDDAHISDRTPLLKATFKDELSGMGQEDQLRLLLDGRKVIAEYDPEDESLLFQIKKPLAVGRHTVECSVRDRSGNPASRAHTFWVK
jgi:hypothetical protein